MPAMAASLLSLPLVVLPLVLGAGPAEKPPTAPAATPTPRADAWAVWASWPQGTISDESISLIRTLEPGRKLSLDEMKRVSEEGAELERATEHLRRGLAQPACTASDMQGALAVMELADAVGLRALLLGLQGEPGAPLLTDLLTAGRRAARCPGSLLSFEIGRAVERRAFMVILWLVERRHLTADEARVLGEVLRKDALTARDFSKALTHEEALIRTQLPATPDVARLWSRKETEALLARHMAGLRAMIESGSQDLQPARDATSRLIDKEDEQYLSAVQADQPGDLFARLSTPRQVTLPTRPNVIGRFLLKRTLESIIQVVDRTSTELQLQRGQFEGARVSLARLAATERGSPARPGTKTDGGPLVPPPPVREAPEEPFGSCKQTGPGRYVVDDLAMRRIESQAPDTVAMQARIVPAFKDGRGIGMKLFKVKEGSFPATCGFKNGDLLTELNGHPLTDPEQALTAIELVKKQRRAAFRIQRGEQTVDLVIEPPAR
jgi:hypothetical protein